MSPDSDPGLNPDPDSVLSPDPDLLFTRQAYFPLGFVFEVSEFLCRRCCTKPHLLFYNMLQLNLITFLSRQLCMRRIVGAKSVRYPSLTPASNISVRRLCGVLAPELSLILLVPGDGCGVECLEFSVARTSSSSVRLSSCLEELFPDPSLCSLLLLRLLLPLLSETS
jgi:hypothetical protein